MRRLLLACILSLLVPAWAHASIAYVRSCYAYSGNTCTLTGVGAGDFLFVALSANGSLSSASCSDASGDTWANIAVVAGANGTATYLLTAYAANVTGGNTTVTCTSAYDNGIDVAEFSGVATAAPVDTYNTLTALGSSGATTATYPSVTVATGEAVIAAGASESTSGGSFNSPFLTIHYGSSHWDAQGYLLGGSGAVTPTMPSSNAFNWCGVSVAVKAGGGTTEVVPRHGASECCGRLR